tara:strand:- start:82 stop:663 length:582 start_codon:yes stop_codon:yes gene_type:complete
MGTLQVGGTTLATKNVSTGKVDLNSTNTAFPSGHMIFIKSQDRTGVGSVGDPNTTFFPTTTTDLATKSFYLTITSSEHAPFSKIKVDFSASCRMNEATHNFADYRLVRWTGTGNVSSETVLLRHTVGTAVDSPSENYHNLVGSAIDDISSLGSVQINYTLQYKNGEGSSGTSENFFFGHDSNIKMQIHAIGII